MSGKIDEILDQYFLPRELLAANTKSDGKIYHTYRAWLRQEYWRNQSPACYIIKEISKPQTSVYKTLSQIRHSNLETVYDVLECEGHFYAINEYIFSPSLLFESSRKDTSEALSLEHYLHHYNGSLRQETMSYEERIQQALIILLQLSEALKPLHEVGFIHGDIHPGNILLTDIPTGPHLQQTEKYSYYVKLIDFDNTQIAKHSNHTVTHLMGSKPFAAPEILDFTHPLDRADIYSLGCILYFAVYGSSPKDISPNEQKICHKWANRIFRRCTASYEARYRNPSALIKDLKHALWIPSNPVNALIHKLPGFRTHTVWKMVIAVYIYLSILMTLGMILFSAFQHGLPLQEDETAMLCGIIFWILEIIIVCNAFQIGEHCEKYIYFKNAHPFLNYILKAVIALLVLLLFIFSLYCIY